MEAKAFILVNSGHLKYKNRWNKINSLYGIVNKLNFENFISGELEIKNNKPIILKFNLKGVTRVEISYCFLTNPMRNFGVEYSISDLETKIIAFKKETNWSKKIFREKEMKTSLKPEERHSQNLKQIRDNLYYDENDYYNEDALIQRGKYFNSRKKVYILNSKENQKKLGEYNNMTAFTLKRTDLINIEEEIPLKVGIVIKFYGDNLSIDEIYKNNNWLINENINFNENILENINE